MGLEGLVSKRQKRPYRAGWSRDWVKVKNRRHPAMSPRDGYLQLRFETRQGHRLWEKIFFAQIGRISISMT
jgi:ATP-dependent DNA ligase